MWSYLLRRLMLFFNLALLLTILAYAIGYFGPKDGISLSADFFSGYLPWLGAALRGDLGTSVVNFEPVTFLLGQVLPPTLQLLFCALLVALLIGIPAGVIAALNLGKWPDHLVRLLVFVGLSLPHFWWAYLLIITFSVELGWLPISGQQSLRLEVLPITGFSLIDALLAPSAWRWQAFIDALRHMLLPTIVLATVPTMVVTRVMRSTMLDVMDKRFIKAARAKGLSMAYIVRRHALRNAISPVIMALGLQMNAFLTSVIVIEALFEWPGIGNWLVTAVEQRDYPAIQGGLLAVSCFIILIGIVFDLMQNLGHPMRRKELYATQ